MSNDAIYNTLACGMIIEDDVYGYYDNRHDHDHFDSDSWGDIKINRNISVLLWVRRVLVKIVVEGNA